MKRSKLSDLYLSLSDSERFKFSEFVTSAFFNKNNMLIKFDKFLSSNTERFFNNEYPEVKIWERITIKKTFTDSGYRLMISQYTSLLEKFLIVNRLLSNEGYSNKFLLEELFTRSIKSQFDKKWKDMRDSLQEKPIADTEEQFLKYDLELKKFHMQILEDELTQELNIEEVSGELDKFYYSVKLNLVHLIEHIEKSVNPECKFEIEGRNSILKDIDKKISEGKYLDTGIYIRYLILKTISEPDKDEYYYKLKKKMIENEEKIHPDMLDYVSGALKNYCVTKTLTGDERFINERYEIYHHIEKSKHFKKSTVSSTDFLNSVSVFLSVEKSDEALNYITKNKVYLIPETRDDTVNLAQAHICFYGKKNDAAIEHLNNTSYRNTYFYLNSRCLLARLYFDKGEINAAEYVTDAAKQYLKRNRDKISDYEFEMFSNFFRIFSMLLKSNKKTFNRDEIKYELGKLKTVSGRKWLIEKLG